MTNPPQAKDIFLQALDKDSAEQRLRYLDKACCDDADLRRRVDALLAAHDAPESFLDRPAMKFGTAQTEDHGVESGGESESEPLERPGTMIGPYKLLQEIGHGGFGVVYMAEQQEPVRRQVALKIIKPGMDTREVIARFEAERQALALMDHPNIARVLDAGATATGRPYFVMELVKGVPVTVFCDKNNLTTRQRLELFATVCQAVQHAHQKGVIHRDIKPTNVMVTLHDGKPVAKVIDFGISKAISQRLTEKTLFTRFGQMVGTPQYMSPEQAEMSGLDVDTRSDIYSLGVLLYELLTGTTPLDVEKLRAAGYAEMLRLIQEEESPKPSTRLSTLNERLSIICKQRSTNEKQIRQLVRGDLDWIVMKALEKDRNRRYETASSLAEDLQRHLNDEAVLAGPPTASYRLRKLVRRKKRLVIAVGAVAGALIVGMSLAIAGYVQASKQRDAAESSRRSAVAAEAEALRQKEFAQEQQDLAQLQRNEAESQARQARAVLDLLNEMLSTANPQRANGADYAVRDLLNDFSTGLEERLREQPKVEAEIRTTIGQAYVGLGEYDAGVSHLRRALEIRRELPGIEQTAIGDSLAVLASALHEKSQFSGKVTADRDNEYFELAQESVRILEETGEQASLARALYGLAWIIRWDQSFEQAEPYFKKSLAIAHEIHDDDSSELKAKIMARMANGMIASSPARFHEAYALSNSAIELYEAASKATAPQMGHALVNLGLCQVFRMEFKEAEANFAAATQIFRNEFAKLTSGEITSLWGSSLALTLQYREDDAIKLYEDTIGFYREKDSDFNEAELLEQIAGLYEFRGNLLLAEDFARRALDKSIATDGMLGLGAIRSRNTLARCLVQESSELKVAEGRRLFALLMLVVNKFAEDIDTDWRAAEPIVFGVAHLESPSSELTALALRVADKALTLAKGTPFEAGLLMAKGELFEKTGMVQEAESHFELALALRRPGLAYEDRRAVDGLVRIAMARGDTERAEAALRDACDRVVSTHPENHHAIEYPRLRLGEFLLDAERYKEAEEQLRTCYDRLASHSSPVVDWQLRAAKALSRLYEKTDEPEKRDEWQNILATLETESK